MNVHVWILPLWMGRFGDSASGEFLPILLAQGMDAPGMEWLGLFFFIVLPLGMILSIHALITAALVSDALRVLPPEYRAFKQVVVWLLLIPGVSLIGNFFVCPKVSRAYQRYFAGQGRTEHGDCGWGLGLGFAFGFAACWCGPYLLYVSASDVFTAWIRCPLCLCVCAWPTVGLWIAYLVRIGRLRKHVIG
jgi:hypothetical protein